MRLRRHTSHLTPQRSRTSQRAPWVVLALATAWGLAGCGNEAPENPFAPELGNVLRGTVVAGNVPVTQPVILFLSDANNPMPPAGTGRPITFGTVPGRDFTEVERGVRAAPFSLTGLPDGDFLLTGFMDLDRNFHPGASTLAGATCGDLAGAWLGGLDSTTPEVISVAGDELIDNIAVLLGRRIPTERPAFTVAEDAQASLGGVLQLSSVAIEARFGDIALSLTGPFNTDAPDPCDTAFWVHLRDEDADGEIDPHPTLGALGASDVWPRVYLRWLGEPVDENQDGFANRFDRGGIPSDVSFATEGLPFAPQLATLPPEQLEPRIGSPFPVTSLDVALPPVARRFGPEDPPEGSIVSAADVPAGAWSITVVSETGQTWAIPNELETRLSWLNPVPPPGVTSESLPEQGRWIYID